MLETCCLDQGNVNYLPSVPGNLTYAAIFITLLVFQVAVGVYFREWTITILMTIGVLLEILGYAARTWMHYKIFNRTSFLM